MQRSYFLILLSVIFLLVSCSGSDVYQGTWKAKDIKGNASEIIFTDKTIEVKDADGEIHHYNYTQNSIKINNGIKTYGIKFSDGRAFLINFPKPKDESVAIIMTENGKLVYTIGRNAYINASDLQQF